MAPRRSDKSEYTKKFITNLVEFQHESQDKAWEYYVKEGARWDNKDSSLINNMGIYISINKESYEIKRQPQKAVLRAKKEGIKLDRMKGKYKMYFLEDGVIATNFDDVLPNKFRNKIDWSNEKRRNYTLPSEGIAEIIRPNIMKDFESDNNEEVSFKIVNTNRLEEI